MFIAYEVTKELIVALSTVVPISCFERRTACC